MDIQEYLNAAMSAIADERSNYHVTLGEMIDAARGCSGNVLYRDGSSPGEEMSYRGYYSDLSFEDGSNAKTAEEFLSQLERSLGSEYTGYKGGENMMSETTPLWRADYGNTGEAIISADVHDGDLILTTKYVD